jgi:hypothetical protein
MMSVAERYVGRVLLGGRAGLEVAVEIDDLDSVHWKATPTTTRVLQGITARRAMSIELLDGPRAGEVAVAELGALETDLRGALLGQSAFGVPED